MRDLATIACRLLEVRAMMRELEREGAGCSDAHTLENARLLAHRATAEALAWALEIDLNQIDIPASLLAPEEQPTTVQLHRLELGEAPHTLVMWLTEIPAHHDARGPDYSTESWSCFLHDERARGLLDALSAALPATSSGASGEQAASVHLPRLRSRTGVERRGDRTGDRTGNRALAVALPPEPDVEGGYADYAGLSPMARLTPSACDACDAGDDADDDSDDDAPPAASAVVGPRGA